MFCTFSVTCFCAANAGAESITSAAMKNGFRNDFRVMALSFQ